MPKTTLLALSNQQAKTFTTKEGLRYSGFNIVTDLDSAKDEIVDMLQRNATGNWLVVLPLVPHHPWYSDLKYYCKMNKITIVAWRDYLTGFGGCK